MENNNTTPPPGSTPNSGTMPFENDIPSPSNTPIQAVPSGQSSTELNQIATSSSDRGNTKKFLSIMLFILILAGGLFAVVKFVLPNLRQVAGSKVELSWWGLWEDPAIPQQVIDEYQKANPNVIVKYEKKDKENYREKLTSSFAKDEGPDIFRLHNSWVPMFRQELSTLPASVMTSEEFKNTFYPVAADDLIGPEGAYAIPLEYDGLAMFINEEIFATYGKTIPTDWNDLRKIAKELTIKDDRGLISQSGAALGTTSNVDHWPEIVALLMLQNGANPNKPNDTTGRGAQALRFYKQFSEIDETWDDTQPSSTIAFANGKLAMYFGPSWRALEIKEINPSLKFRVDKVPQLPKSDPNAPDITYASYWVEGVASKSKNKEESWKFLKFLSQKETLQKMYQSASSTRLFGEPYSRVDMRDMLLSDPVLGGFMELAPNAKSGYLASRTFDGTSGINTSLEQYYTDALNSISADNESTKEVSTLAIGVQQVLARYGLAAPIPTSKK